MDRDTHKLNNTYLIGINSSFHFAEFKNFNDPTIVNNLRQFEITISPKFGVFLNNYLSVGIQWRYGWYWSNFNKSFPNSSSGGPFLEYYFTQWRSYKWNTINRKGKAKVYMHPYINLGYNFKNFYTGIDTFNNKGAIFNNRNDNQSLNALFGFNFSTKRRVNFNFALGVQYSKQPNNLLQNTKLVRLLPTSEIGVVVYFHKKRKKQT